MELDLAALPEDVDALHQLIRQLAAERTGERKALSAAQAEIERLRLIVQKLQRLQFGRRAERLDSDQLELGLEDLGADIGRAEELLPATPDDKQPAARDRSDRPSLPEHLSLLRRDPACDRRDGERTARLGAGAAARHPYPPPQVRLPGLR
jgi:hypothetical protein